MMSSGDVPNTTSVDCRHGTVSKVTHAGRHLGLAVQLIAQGAGMRSDTAVQLTIPAMPTELWSELVDESLA